MGESSSSPRSAPLKVPANRSKSEFPTLSDSQNEFGSFVPELMCLRMIHPGPVQHARTQTPLKPLSAERSDVRS